MTADDVSTSHQLAQLRPRNESRGVDIVGSDQEVTAPSRSLQ